MRIYVYCKAMWRAALLGMIALGACKHSATSVPACDEHLAHRRACADQLGGELGNELAREADRLEALWTSPATQQAKNWKDKYGKKWCTAATAEARTAFPECRW